MKKIAELKEIIAGGEFDEKLAQIYLDKDMIPYNRERYVKALDKFTELFGDQEVAIYSAPGRSEVCGNHTDHQNGHVLATSINLDAIAVVAPREDGVIELVSDDMPKEVINVNDIEQDPALEGTTTYQGRCCRDQRLRIQGRRFHSICDKRCAHGSWNVIISSI